MRNPKIKKVYIGIIIMGLFIIMTFIFMMSAKPVEQSADMSYMIDENICRIFIDEYESLPRSQQTAIAMKLDFWVRKSAHCFEYIILGIMLTLTAGIFSKTRERQYLIALCAGSAYALLDEMHQYFVPGRSCEFRDIVIDSIGVVIGVVVVRYIRRKHRYSYTAGGVNTE